MAAINWKNFTLNSSGDSAPWGSTEVQLHKDLIDTLVKDTYSAVADTTNGHRHYRVYDTGSNVLFRGVSAGVMRQEYSSSYYLQTTVYSNGDVSLKPVGTHLTVTEAGVNPDVQNAVLNIDGRTQAHLCLYNNSTYYTLLTSDSSGYLKIAPSGGRMGIGVTPSYKFSVGSADNSDQVGIYHDNTDGFIKWSDGILNLATDEGTNTLTEVDISPKGTGEGLLRVYGPSKSNNVALYSTATVTSLFSTGTGLNIQANENELLGFYGATPVDKPETVADPTGGATTDAEARTAIGAIIDRLQELGLIK